MTFTEAAVEVLRLVGRPLHYKKIAEIAVAKNLLSHVGKQPDMTMSSRLATMIKKDRGDEPIVKVKPGIFALREFDKKTMALADADFDIDIDSLPDIEPSGDDEEVSEAVVEAQKNLPGSDVFPAEEDDDEPILAKVESKDDSGSSSSGGGSDDDSGKSSRRRRRRRGRRGKERDDGGNDDRDSGSRDSGRRDSGRRDSGRGDSGRGGSGRGRSSSRRRSRGGEREKIDMSRSPEAGDLAGRELADAIEAVLKSAPREPTTYAATADLLVKKKRLSGNAAALAPSVAAAVRADLVRHGGAAPRFREIEGRLALTEWYLPRDAAKGAEDLAGTAAKQRELMFAHFLKKLSDLPAAGFVELLATWLNAEGVTGLRAVRRPTSSDKELHLAGTLRRAHEQVPLAIVVLRDGRDLDAETVVEVRGALHHYGQATMAWLVTLGGTRSKAREEVSVGGGAAPVVLFDGDALARAMSERGVGLRTAHIAVPMIDLDLLDALRGEPDSPEEEDDDRGGRGRRGSRRGGKGRDDDQRGRGRGRGRDRDDSDDDDSDEGDDDSGGDEEESGRSRRSRRRRGGRKRDDDEQSKGSDGDDSGDDDDSSRSADDDDAGKPRGRRRRRRGGRKRDDDEQGTGSDDDSSADGDSDDSSDDGDSDGKPARSRRRRSGRGRGSQKDESDEDEDEDDDDESDDEESGQDASSTRSDDDDDESDGDDDDDESDDDDDDDDDDDESDDDDDDIEDDEYSDEDGDDTEDEGDEFDDDAEE